MLNFLLWFIFLLSINFVITYQQPQPELVISPKVAVDKKPIGDNFYAICAGVGEPHPKHFRWLYPSGEEISTQDNRIYAETDGARGRMYIHNITSRDAGTYICIANVAGVDFHKNITLLTYQPIKFLKAPQVQEIVVNTTAKVYCTVIGEPPLEVEWPLLPHNISDRVIYQEDGILIKDVRESDEGKYTCLATNNELGMMKDRSIYVRVTTPPIWSIIPTDTTGLVGLSLSVTCSATGKPKPKIAFFKDDAQIPTNSVKYAIDPVKGSLTVNNLLKGVDEGIYNCQAINTAGTIETEFRIHLLEPPAIKRFDNVTIVEKENLELECLAQGDPQPQISFVREGDGEIEIYANHDKLIDNRYTFELQTLSQQISKAKLYVKNVNRSDRGIYKCLATNKAGRGENTAYVDVQYAPIIDKSISQDIYFIWSSKPQTLTCKADANPFPIFKWYFRGTDLSSHTMYYDPYTGISKFQINDTSREYADGDWRCEATNIYGTDVHEYQIRQAHKPRSLTNVNIVDITPTTIKLVLPQNQLIFETNFPILNVSVIYVIYRIRPTNRIPNAAISRDKVATFLPGGPYILHELRPDTEYELNFILNNPVGNSSMSREFYAQTIKHSAPYTPKIISQPILDLVPDNNLNAAAAKWKNVYSVVWKEPLDGGKPILAYEIQWLQGVFGNTNVTNFKASDSGNNVVQSRKVKAPNRMFVVKDLDEGTTYKISVRAINEIGASPWDSILVKVPQSISDISLAHTSILMKVGGQGKSSVLNRGIWIALIIMICFTLLILVDVYCYCNKRHGVIMLLKRKICGSTDETKLQNESVATVKPYDNSENVRNGGTSLSINRLFYNQKGRKQARNMNGGGPNIGTDGNNLDSLVVESNGIEEMVNEGRRGRDGISERSPMILQTSNPRL